MEDLQSFQEHQIKYIIITDCYGFWDEIPAGVTPEFAESIIDCLVMKELDEDEYGMPKEEEQQEKEVTTLFVRTGIVQPAYWIGKCKNFRRGRNRKNNKAVLFDVSDLRPCSCPPWFAIANNGWFLNPKHDDALALLRPPFLAEMKECQQWKVFELYCYYLLRLLGIQNIYPYLQKRLNKGKPDGMFAYGNLFVYYDATLRPDFIQEKERQIDNYFAELSKLERGYIKQVRYDLTSFQKQIWIITKGDNEETSFDKYVGDVQVKEVPYQKLESLYYQSIQEEIPTHKLADLLKNL